VKKRAGDRRKGHGWTGTQIRLSEKPEDKVQKKQVKQRHFPRGKKRRKKYSWLRVDQGTTFWSGVQREKQF